MDKYSWTHSAISLSRHLLVMIPFLFRVFLTLFGRFIIALCWFLDLRTLISSCLLYSIMLRNDFSLKVIPVIFRNLSSLKLAADSLFLRICSWAFSALLSPRSPLRRMNFMSLNMTHRLAPSWAEISECLRSWLIPSRMIIRRFFCATGFSNIDFSSPKI